MITDFQLIRLDNSLEIGSSLMPLKFLAVTVNQLPIPSIINSTKNGFIHLMPEGYCRVSKIQIQLEILWKIYLYFMCLCLQMLLI